METGEFDVLKPRQEARVDRLMQSVSNENIDRFFENQHRWIVSKKVGDFALCTITGVGVAIVGCAIYAALTNPLEYLPH